MIKIVWSRSLGAMGTKTQEMKATWGSVKVC